jgi:hypothetical protein
MEICKTLSARELKLFAAFPDLRESLASYKNTDSKWIGAGDIG